MDGIRNYRTTVQLTFDEWGDSFSLNVPHHKKWLAIIMFLRNRGFKVGENAYYKEQYPVLSKYHKIGFKKDVVCLMEITGNMIIVQFCNVKNLWKDMPQSFWDNTEDERFTKLSYLEDLAVKLEIKKLMRFCERYNLEKVVEDKDLTPEAFILNKLKINSHIHGKVTCLNDIKLSIKEDSYDYLSNSNDKNKKKIICGDEKAFYDYHTGRLSIGIAWHNINNMWWMLTSGRKYNIASFELFDYDPSLPKRKPVDSRKINDLLNKYEAKKDYQKCLNIKKYADKVVETHAA